MRWTAIFVAAAIGLGCCAASLIDARADQSVASGEAGPDGPRNGDDDQAAVPVHRMRGWQLLPPYEQGGPDLGLVYTAPDRKLTAGDVQKIAEAFLLWHGNHGWRVTSLTDDADRVSFAIATEQNAVVATFSMNRHTGALTRLS
jgi:hypothetical protein